jgi:hypothetical protein
MNDAQVVFTPWLPWEDRDLHQHAHNQGLNLLAHYDRASVPAGSASPLDAAIVYIGETHAQALSERWKQFGRSASTGARGHAGGCSYHGRFTRIQEQLYVACFSPHGMKSERCRSFFICYTEARLVWAFACVHEPDQLCNKA